MKKLLTMVLFAAFLLAGCGTSKRASILSYSTPLPENAKVEVSGEGQGIPDGAKLLGSVKIGDAGLSAKCGYDTVINDAQGQARAMGGNYLHITEHKYPSIWSSCHRIQADVYLVEE